MATPPISHDSPLPPMTLKMAIFLVSLIGVAVTSYVLVRHDVKILREKVEYLSNTVAEIDSMKLQLQRLEDEVKHQRELLERHQADTAKHK